jgi:hypothetical protein
MLHSNYNVFGRAGGAKEPDVLEKAFARSHRVFVEGTLKEPTILKWVSSHQHRRWPQHGGGVLFWGRSANGLTAPGSPFSAVGEWGLTPPVIGPILRTAFRSRFPG